VAKPRYIIAIDQGTTSSRALLLDEKARIVGVAQKEFRQIYTKPGWVEHDPDEILSSQMLVLRTLIRDHRVSPESVVAIGITNQRETSVVWERSTGRPIANAIVWQDRRTAPICESLRQRGLDTYIKRATGLVVDAYFSGTKVQWILDNVDGARVKAERGELAFGTVDTWLLWNLTGGKVHATDYSNASRTMLFNIRDLRWDEKLLSEFGIPSSLLPEVKPSSTYFGDWSLEGHAIPVRGIAGDQQAALFGQACFEPGMAKNTYGTGCFMLMNTGEKIQYSSAGLITTIAWGLDGKVEYALEGSVFIAGAVVQWLRDELKIIGSGAETETMALNVADSDGVYVVPAFAGLGAPYWDMYARGAIFGLTRDTGRDHLAKASLESMAYQTRDILEAMQLDSGLKLLTLKVDGGACANNYLMQFQADLLGAVVERPSVIESTAMGAACLAALDAGFWRKQDIVTNRALDRTFRPVMPEAKRQQLYAGWKKAVSRSRGWLES
jgi:glycerol kinase